MYINYIYIYIYNIVNVEKNVKTIIISISKSNSCGATGGTCGILQIRPLAKRRQGTFWVCGSWRLEIISP